MDFGPILDFDPFFGFDSFLEFGTISITVDLKMRLFWVVFKHCVSGSTGIFPLEKILVMGWMARAEGELEFPV